MALEFIDTFEVEPTNNCNAKCIFCPRDALVRAKGYLSWDTYKAIINKALELKIKKIIFGGFGEPFLHKDLIEYFSYLNSNTPGIEIHIITNASLLTSKIIDDLNALNITEMVVSFNGYDKESYEKTMIHLSFDKVIGNLKYIADNATDFAKKIRFIPVQTKIFKDREYYKMENLLIGLGFKKENFVGYYPCINRCGYLNNPEVVESNKALEQKKQLYPVNEVLCTRFVNFLQIAWNGDIRLCYNDINNEALLGNIKTSSNEEIQEKILYFRNPKTKPLICQRCDDPFLRGGYKHLKR